MVRGYNLYWADGGASHGTNQGPRAGWSWSNKGLSSFPLLHLYFFLFAHGCRPRGYTLTHAVKRFFIKFWSKLCVCMWVRERAREKEREIIFIVVLVDMQCLFSTWVAGHASTELNNCNGYWAVWSVVGWVWLVRLDQTHTTHVCMYVECSGHMNIETWIPWLVPDPKQP